MATDWNADRSCQILTTLTLEITILDLHTFINQLVKIETGVAFEGIVSKISNRIFLEISTLLELALLNSEDKSEDLFDRSNLADVVNKDEKKAVSEPLREYSRRKKHF